MKEKGIEIRGSQDTRIAISQKGLEIRREGKPVNFEMFETGSVYLVIDCSSSMQEGDKLNQAKRGVINFAKEAKTKGYSIGLIQFHSYATHLCEPVQEISILEQHLKTLDVGGGTYMAEAISLAHKKLKNRKENRVMVIATDGEANGPGDPKASLKAGEKAKKDDIGIIVIGTDDADQEFLRKLASRTELGIKVSREQFEKSITSITKMLPKGKR